MGIKLPQMTASDIEELENHMLYLSLLNGMIAEEELTDEQRETYKAWLSAQ